MCRFLFVAIWRVNWSLVVVGCSIFIALCTSLANKPIHVNVVVELIKPFNADKIAKYAYYIEPSNAPAYKIVAIGLNPKNIDDICALLGSTAQVLLCEIWDHEAKTMQETSLAYALWWGKNFLTNPWKKSYWRIFWGSNRSLLSQKRQKVNLSDSTPEWFPFFLSVRLQVLDNKVLNFAFDLSPQSCIHSRLPTLGRVGGVLFDFTAF